MPKKILSSLVCPLPALLLFFISTSCREKNQHDGWTKYNGGFDNIHYSSLTQVDTGNVAKLTVAWTLHTGDADSIYHSQIQCNPIIVNGTIYGTTAKMKLFAADAASGKKIWGFNPFDSVGGNKKMFFVLNNCRGVTYWEDGRSEKRIYYTAGSNLYAVDATSGRLVTTFGHQGSVDLHEGLDRDVPDLFVTATSPPVIYKNWLIMGSRVDEGAAAAPGHIRAYDVKTGRRAWIFHTIPHPGEKGFDTWDDSTAYRFIGGANAWSGLTLDEEHGIVFACTGSASYDWYGGRRQGDGLFADCVLALDAATGKLLWHYQNIHHDVWDLDLSSPPALVTGTKNGSPVAAVAVTTKTGFLLLFDRLTGKPVYDIVEIPVPHKSDLEGEKLSPTQPVPTRPAPFMRQGLSEKDINPLLPDSDYNEVKKRWAAYKHDSLFQPPSLQGTVEFPGIDGGAEWGGPAFDPETHLLYINANEMAWVIQSVRVQDAAGPQENYLQAGKRLYLANCMTCHGPDKKGSGDFPSLLDVHNRYTAGAFDSLLRTGRRMMPSFARLGGEERQAIASFVLGQNALAKKSFVSVAGKTNDPSKLPYTITGYNKFLSRTGQPAVAPPWGTLSAIDLNTGNYVWKQPLGNDTSVKNAPAPTGVENYGGSVVTAGGLLFIAAAKDGKFRAFNKRTGRLLWETPLPAPGFATPAIYELNGKEYIVVACGGGKMNTPSGDSYIAFALP